MHKPVKYFEKAITVGANAAWQVFDRVNQISQNPFLYPKVVGKAASEELPEVEAAARVAARNRFALSEVHSGDPAEDRRWRNDYKILLNQPVGEIKAKIIERDGKILMVKECAIHGQFEDLMSIDPAFFKAPGRCFPGARHSGT